MNGKAKFQILETPKNMRRQKQMKTVVKPQTPHLLHRCLQRCLLLSHQHHHH